MLRVYGWIPANHSHSSFKWHVLAFIIIDYGLQMYHIMHTLQLMCTPENFWIIYANRFNDLISQAAEKQLTRTIDLYLFQDFSPNRHFN